MGNFASSTSWIDCDVATVSSRQKLAPLSIRTTTTAAKRESSSDIVASLISQAIATCKESIRCVLFHAFTTPTAYTNGDDAAALAMEEGNTWDDDFFDEFQIVYEESYTHKHKRKLTTTPARRTNNVFKDTPWFVYSPSDFDTIKLQEKGKCACGGDQDDEDTRSATTESTEWLSETDHENPADSDNGHGSDSYSDSDSDFDDFSIGCDDIEMKAARLLHMASSCPQETFLFVEDYLCKCGECPQYHVIEKDVATLVTWREPEELRSVVRLLQAFSTYNETIKYQADMIATADECLRIWSGDEDQAFTSFVMLQDEVPFLCASVV